MDQPPTEELQRPSMWPYDDYVLRDILSAYLTLGDVVRLHTALASRHVVWSSEVRLQMAKDMGLDAELLKRVQTKRKSRLFHRNDVGRRNVRARRLLPPNPLAFDALRFRLQTTQRCLECGRGNVPSTTRVCHVCREDQRCVLAMSTRALVRTRFRALAVGERPHGLLKRAFCELPVVKKSQTGEFLYWTRDVDRLFEQATEEMRKRREERANASANGKKRRRVHAACPPYESVLARAARHPSQMHLTCDAYGAMCLALDLVT